MEVKGGKNGPLAWQVDGHPPRGASPAPSPAVAPAIRPSPVAVTFGTATASALSIAASVSRSAATACPSRLRIASFIAPRSTAFHSSTVLIRIRLSLRITEKRRALIFLFSPGGYSRRVTRRQMRWPVISTQVGARGFFLLKGHNRGRTSSANRTWSKRRFL